MKKPRIIILSATILLTTFFFVFLYLDYKKNPITYIILSKKFEIVSYLFFRDLPAIYPSYNSYDISYRRDNNDKGIKESFNQGMGYVTISGFRDIYKTGIPNKLRKIFDQYAKLNPNKKEDLKIIEDVVGTANPKGIVLNLVLGFNGVAKYDEDLQKRIKEYIDLFSKKFIVTSITEYKSDEQCGNNSYDIGIIIDSNPLQDLTIGLTNSGKICFIWDENFRLYKYEIKDFKISDEYKDYWL